MRKLLPVYTVTRARNGALQSYSCENLSECFKRFPSNSYAFLIYFTPAVCRHKCTSNKAGHEGGGSDPSIVC
jgi:hypothetical protein